MSILARLLGRRYVWLIFALMVAGGLFLGRVPLLQVPGYELAELGCVISAILGGLLGIDAARTTKRDRRASALGAFTGASLVLLVALGLLFAVSALRVWISSPCSAMAGLAFLPVLAVPTALFACGVGVLCGGLWDSRGGATVLYVIALAISLTEAISSAYSGPQAFGFDHFLGYWPGPIYDEAVSITRQLLTFRGVTLLWTTGVVAAAAYVIERSAGALLLAALFGLSVLMAHLYRVDLGYDGSRAHIRDVLGGVREGKRCTVVFAREKRADEAERISRDCEYDAAQVIAALGLEKPPHPTIYLYRNAEEKRRLVGAGQTNYAKPWVPEIHLNEDSVPHPILRHELVHALASNLADGPLHVPARMGIFPSTGIIEGLAVAIELPRGEWTVHEWTRAMRELGVMPPVAKLVGPAGFFAAAPARAYTVAGSFLKFLIDKHGPAQVRSAYADGDFNRAFGRPLAALEQEWSLFLDGVALPASLKSAAEERFREGSLFEKQCAREVAALEERASSAASGGRKAEAADLWKRAADLAPGDPSYSRWEADAWRSAGELEKADVAYQEALKRAQLKGDESLRAIRGSLESALGDLRWRAGQHADAKTRYEAALPLAADRAEQRMLRAKLAALETPALRAAVAPWLLDVGDRSVALLRLSSTRSSTGEYFRMNSGRWPIADYLVGRALMQRGAPMLALDAFGRISDPLPDASFQLELQRLRGQALCLVGSWDDGIAVFDGIADSPERNADREKAKDDAKRCGFEKSEYGKPALGPEELPL